MNGICHPNRHQSGSGTGCAAELLSATRLIMAPTAWPDCPDWTDWPLGFVSSFPTLGSYTSLCWCFSSWILNSVSTVPSLALIFTFLTSLQTFLQLFLCSLSEIQTAVQGQSWVIHSRYAVCQTACDGSKLTAHIAEMGTADGFWFVCLNITLHRVGV